MRRLQLGPPERPAVSQHRVPGASRVAPNGPRARVTRRTLASGTFPRAGPYLTGGPRSGRYARPPRDTKCQREGGHGGSDRRPPGWSADASPPARTSTDPPVARPHGAGAHSRRRAPRDAVPPAGLDHAHRPGGDRRCRVALRPREGRGLRGPERRRPTRRAPGHRRAHRRRRPGLDLLDHPHPPRHRTRPHRGQQPVGSADLHGARVPARRDPVVPGRALLPHPARRRSARSSPVRPSAASPRRRSRPRPPRPRPRTRGRTSTASTCCCSAPTPATTARARAPTRWSR